MSTQRSGDWPTLALATLLTDAPQSLEPARCAGEVTEEDWTGCSQKVKKDKELLGKESGAGGCRGCPMR